MKELVNKFLGGFGVELSRKKDSGIPLDNIMQKIILEYDINLVLDVGANTGQFAEGLRNFYSGMIVSFEPISEYVAALEKKAASDDSWLVMPFALGEESKTLEINLYKGTQLGSFLQTNEFSRNWLGSRANQKGKEKVGIKRFDEVVDSLPLHADGTRILLKSDTQGFDLSVFEGMGDSISDVHAILSEASVIPIYAESPHWLEALKIYENHGFSVVDLTPVSRDGHFVVEYDCLMVKR